MSIASGATQLQSDVKVDTTFLGKTSFSFGFPLAKSYLCSMKRTIPVLGMACAGCAANVERRLREIEGVETAAVNYAARTALVEYDEKSVSPERMKEEIVKAGYDLVVDEKQSVEEIERRAHISLRNRVVISWVLAILAMSIGMGWLRIGSEEVVRQTSLILVLANMIYCGRQFYLNAWRQLMHLSSNMDTLVAMSTIVSLLAGHYDAAIMIITFVLTGRLLEERAKGSTASAIRGLMELTPKTAHIVSGETTLEVPIVTLQVGDEIVVRAGEKIPVDGRVTPTLTSARINEATITGEAALVEKREGDRVYAGTMCVEGELRFRAEQVGKDTLLAQIIRTVEEAQGSKAPVQRVADKVAAVFVPTVIAIAAVTGLAWWLIAGNEQQAIQSAVAVLVIACPCALGLATPTALMVGIGKAAQKNILIKDATALESLRAVDALVIDKTGTLTTLDEENREVLKPHATEAMESLREMGIEIWMMSGDKKEVVSRWAKEAGIENYNAEVLPQDKEQKVRELQTKGRKVAMVGDGVNDTPALAQADVSIAIGRGTDIAMDTAQVTLASTDLRRIAEAVRLSRQTVGMIHQNLFWAFIYNVVCIPLAAGIPLLFGLNWLITPMWAAALMAMSSVSVVTNSLRLKLKR